MKFNLGALVMNGMIIFGNPFRNPLSNFREIVKFCIYPREIIECIGGAAYSIKDHAMVTTTYTKEIFAAVIFKDTLDRESKMESLSTYQAKYDLSEPILVEGKRGIAKTSGITVTFDSEKKLAT